MFVLFSLQIGRESSTLFAKPLKTRPNWARMVHDLDMSTMFMSKEKEWERLRGNRGEEKYGTEGEGIFVAETTDSSEQLNRTPCLSGTTNNQSLHNITE